MEVVDKPIPDVQQFSDPSPKKFAELLVSIEYIPNKSVSQDIKNYLEPFTRWKGRVTWNTREDFLQKMILSLAKNTPCKRPSNPTEEQHAAERQRRLNALTTRHRTIFLFWPRDPRSRHIFNPMSQSDTMGKTAVKGLQLWGASLFDFYMVHTVDGEMAISTSSRLLGFLKSIGEDYADSRRMVKMAEREGEPRIIEPFGVTQLIQCEEREITAYMHAGRKKKLEEKQKDEEAKEEVVDERGAEKEKQDSAVWEKGKEEESKEHYPDLQDVTQGDDEGEPTGYSGPYPVESLFSPSCYPKGWMREPFSTEHISQRKPTGTPPNLQQYLPQRLLPKTLIVHDPCGLLHAQGIRYSYKEPWSHMKDITHTYTLNVSTKFTNRKREEDTEAENEDEKAKTRLKNFLANPHSTSERPPGYELAIAEPAPDGTVAMAYVVFPEIPRPQPAKEAHLYLTPAKDLGVGNHSHVYDAEFEIPRSLLVKEDLCMDCVHADVEEQLKERAADLKNARRGKMTTKGHVKKPLVLFRGNNTVYELDRGGRDTKTEYVGPYDVVVQTRVRYQNLERAPYCQHFRAREDAVHPLTAKVSVAAKLSIQYDDHLHAEAANYQRFPKHVFEHWSGFRIVRPFEYPVPLGPIVPQFYGYYVPEHAASGRDYLSPILLLEKCGSPISFRELSVDDKQECTSLLYRLHEAGWTHGSTYERNILKQPGPLNASPKDRLGNSTERGGYGVHWSFRLIDFGRSKYVGVLTDEKAYIRRDAVDSEIAKWLRVVGKKPFF